MSHLPAYFSDINKQSMLSFPVAFADMLFREKDVTCLLEATRSSSSLKSQQAMVHAARPLPLLVNVAPALATHLDALPLSVAVSHLILLLALRRAFVLTHRLLLLP